MLPTGTSCEVIFNELTMSPLTTTLLRLLVSDIHAALYNF
jgi:hypothetical protein